MLLLNLEMVSVVETLDPEFAKENEIPYKDNEHLE